MEFNNPVINWYNASSINNTSEALICLHNLNVIIQGKINQRWYLSLPIYNVFTLRYTHLWNSSCYRLLMFFIYIYIYNLFCYNLHYYLYIRGISFVISATILYVCSHIYIYIYIYIYVRTWFCFTMYVLHTIYTTNIYVSNIYIPFFTIMYKGFY